MASEIFLRDDLSIYVLAGVPKSFKSTLETMVKESTDGSGEVKVVNREMTDWVLAKLRGSGRRSFERNPASAALWRAYRALCAARYHLHNEALEEQVRELRTQIEELWNFVSPLNRTDDSSDVAEPSGKIAKA